MIEPDAEPHYFCPHGTEVDFPGGACYWCAQEDARDDLDDGMWYGDARFYMEEVAPGC